MFHRLVKHFALALCCVAGTGILGHAQQSEAINEKTQSSTIANTHSALIFEHAAARFLDGMEVVIRSEADVSDTFVLDQLRLLAQQALESLTQASARLDELATVANPRSSKKTGNTGIPGFGRQLGSTRADVDAAAHKVRVFLDSLGEPDTDWPELLTLTRQASDAVEEAVREQRVLNAMLGVKSPRLN